MFESDGASLYIIHFIVHAGGNMNENKRKWQVLWIASACGQ